MNYILRTETGFPVDLTDGEHGPALGLFTATRPMTLRVGVRLKDGLNASLANIYTARIYHLDASGVKIGETSPISFKKLQGDTKATMHLTGASAPVLLKGEQAQVHVQSNDATGGDDDVPWQVDYMDEQSANDLTPDATQVLARAVGAFRGDVWFVEPDPLSAESNDGKSPVTPFKRISTAIAAAGPGDLIMLAAGAFNLDFEGPGTRVVLPDEVSMIGAGRRLTRIISTTALTAGTIVKPGKRSLVAHMTIEGTSTTAAQAPIGWAGSDPDCDLATLEDLDLVSSTGGLAVSGGTAITLFARRIRTRTKVDSVALSGAAHTLYLWDSVVESIGENDANQVRGMVVKDGARIVAVNCEVRAADSASSTIGCLVHEDGGGEIRLFNCRVDVTRPGSTALYALSKEHASGVLRVTGCAFDRGLINGVLDTDIVPVQADQV